MFSPTSSNLLNGCAISSIFEIKSLAFILISFQVILTLVQRSSFHELLTETQQWYQRNSAERFANSNSTALELLIENMGVLDKNTSVSKEQVIQSFNIILTQLILEQNIEDVAIIVIQDGNVIAIDEGIELYNFLTKNNRYIDNTCK